MDKELLERIDNLEKMLKSCQEKLESYQKAINLFIETYNKK